MSFDDASRKRVRDDVLGSSWSSSITGGGGGSTNASSVLGGEPAASALTASALSFLSASAAGGACSVSSHARLEVLLRQTELMRRLDADAHEAVRAEMAAQSDGLRAHVAALAGAVEGAAAERAASADGVFAGAAAAEAATRATRAANVDLVRLRAALGAAEDERDSACRALDASRRETEAAAAASRAAVKRAESAAAASCAVAEDLYAQLATTAAAGEECAARLAEAQSRLDLYNAGGSVGTAGSFITAEFPPGALSAADAAALRERERGGARRERAAAETIALLRAERGNASLLEERIAAAEGRATRADNTARAVPALTASIRALLASLDSWSTSVWEPLVPPRARTAACDVAGESVGVGGGDIDAQALVGAALDRSAQHVGASARALQALQTQCAAAAEAAARSSARTAQACEKRSEAHARIAKLELALADASGAATRDGDARALADAREAAARGLADGLRATCTSYEMEDRASVAAASAADAARAAVAASNFSAAPTPPRGGWGVKGGAPGGAPSGAALVAAATAAAAAASEAAAACVKSAATRNVQVMSELSNLRVRVAALLAAAASAAPPSALALETARSRSALAEVAEARAEIDLLWSARSDGGSSGEFDEAGAPLRVLHFAANPTSAAFRLWEEKQRALVASLRGEVEALRAAGAGAGDGGLAVAATGAITTENAEKRLKRTIDIFKERATLMRDAVCRLTGWKMDVHFGTATAATSAPNDEEKTVDIHLRSTFADSPVDYLHIRMKGELFVCAVARSGAQKRPALLALECSSALCASLASCLLGTFGAYPPPPPLPPPQALLSI